MTLNYQSAVGVLQKSSALQFTADAGSTDEMTVPIPQFLFAGQIVGSSWFRIDNVNPESGDLSFSLIEAGVNEVRAGITYDGADVGRFFATLNASRFESVDLFDADAYADWMHLAFYIDWQNPADSVVYWNNVLQVWDATPTVDSTQFTPLTSVTPLENAVANMEWAQIYLAPASPDTTPANFASTVLPRLSNQKSPYSLGRRGGYAQGNRNSEKTLPWIYTSFTDKVHDGQPVAPRNDVNDGLIGFGAFTDYQILSNTSVVLP